MEDLNEKKFIEEVGNYYLNLKGTLTFLSPRETELIINWYKKGVNLEKVKKIIKEEIKKYPQRKRKNFSLILIAPKINQLFDKKPMVKSEIKSKWEKVVENLNLPKELLNIPEGYKGDIELYQEKNIISYIWKNMPKEEKQELINQAIKELEKERFFNVDKKHVIKSIIYSKIKYSLI